MVDHVSNMLINLLINQVCFMQAKSSEIHHVHCSSMDMKMGGVQISNSKEYFPHTNLSITWY